MNILPAIDLIDGKCVRLYKGDYATQKIYNENPLDQAKAFEDAGVKYLHLVDLSGAKIGQPVHLKVLERISSRTTLLVDYGGGIRKEHDIADVLSSGAVQVNLGTILIRNPQMPGPWAERFGADRLIAALDVMGEEIKVHGWQEGSGNHLQTTMEQLIAVGFSYFTITDIDRDGTLGEPAFDLYAKLLKQFPAIKLRASGGVTTEEQIVRLREQGCEGAIVGKAIYEGLLDVRRVLSI